MRKKKPQKKCKPKNTEISAKFASQKKKKKSQIPQQGGDKNKSAQERKKERKKGEAREGKLICLFFCPI
jgi:hypothetical protein